MEKITGTPSYLSLNDKYENLLFSWFSFLKFVIVAAPDTRIHQLLRNMLQQSPIYFKYTKVRVLNFGGTPPYLLLKSTNENHKFFPFSNFQLLLLNFKCIYEPSTAINYAEYFWGVLKTIKEKKIWGKLRALYRICLKWQIQKS